MSSKTQANYSATYGYKYGDKLVSITSNFPNEGNVGRAADSRESPDSKRRVGCAGVIVVAVLSLALLYCVISEVGQFLREKHIALPTLILDGHEWTEGAEVYIDGYFAGTMWRKFWKSPGMTEFCLQLLPGPHEVRIHKQGHNDVTLTIELPPSPSECYELVP
jgi:hypothetical protein